MHAVLCDICETPIRGETTEIHLIRGQAVYSDEGRPRVVQRGGATMRYACAVCGKWVEEAMVHLRSTLQHAVGA